MYTQIAQNKRNSIFLISLFAIIIIALGWAFGSYFQDPQFGIILAVLISLVMTLVGYYKGDSVALMTAGAKQIEKRDSPELFRLVENLCIASGQPMPKVYIVEDPAPNAFATGRGPEHASVAVTTGLLQILEKTELEGVLAHELSHIKNYDIRIMTLVVVLVGIIVLFSDWMMRSFFFGRGNKREGSQIATIGIIVGLILAILSPLFAQLIKLAVSRQREYLADASAVFLTRYPDGLARALEKIARLDQPMRKANHATAHLFIANPFDPHVTKRFDHMFSTHPPIEQRIKKLRSMGV
ncbi:MAG: zinc metalloprotease HtpX [Patescibacteria group bacterium]